MGVAENQELVRQMFEKSINARDASAFEEYIGDTYVNHDMPAEPGPAGLKAVMGQFFAAFPDMRIVVEQSIGEGDIVATRGHFEGTHDGDFMGVPATGRKVNVQYMDMWRLQAGKAVENWVRIDTLGLMQQLGAVPGP